MSRVEESAWEGLIRDHRQRRGHLTIRMPLQPARRGVAGSFLAQASDGSQWWVKPPGQGRMDRALVTEFVVSRAGEMIKAPVCPGQVVEIPRDLAGWEFKPGGQLREGTGHATLNVKAAIEERSTLQHRDRDDNRNPSRRRVRPV